MHSRAPWLPTAACIILRHAPLLAVCSLLTSGTCGGRETAHLSTENSPPATVPPPLQKQQQAAVQIRVAAHGTHQRRLRRQGYRPQPEALLVKRYALARQQPQPAAHEALRHRCLQRMCGGWRAYSLSRHYWCRVLGRKRSQLLPAVRQAGSTRVHMAVQTAAGAGAGWPKHLTSCSCRRRRCKRLLAG